MKPRKVALAPCLFAVLMLVFGGPGSLAQEKSELREVRDRLWKEAVSLARSGKLRECIARGEEALALDRRLFGDRHDEVDGSLLWLSERCEDLGDREAARRWLVESLELRTDLYGEDDWRTHSIRVSLVSLDRRRALTPEGEEAVRLALESANRAYALASRKRLDEALALLEKSEEILARHLGEDHPSVVSMLSNHGMLLGFAGRYREAAEIERRVAAAKAGLVGVDHPESFSSLVALGKHLIRAGDLLEAERVLRRAATGLHRLVGEDDPRTRTATGNLADVLERLGELEAASSLLERVVRRMRADEKAPVLHFVAALKELGRIHLLRGRLREARSLLEEQLQIRRDSFAPGSPFVAAGLGELSLFFVEIGDVGRAEELQREALELSRAGKGANHPETAIAKLNLATMLLSAGRGADAEVLATEALASLRDRHGERHTSVLHARDVEAMVLHDQGHSTAALKLQRATVDASVELLGKDHSETGRRLGSLAGGLLLAGHAKEAEAPAREALGILEGALGTEHPELAEILRLVAHARLDAGEDPGESVALLGRALEISERALDLAFSVESEREQLLTLARGRALLDEWLSAALAAGEDPGGMLERSVRFRGRVLDRQLRLRLAARSEETRELFAELDTTCRRLASLSGSRPGPDGREVWRRQIEELARRKERIESDLAEAEDVGSVPPATVAELRRAVPSDAGLVVYVEFVRRVAGEDGRATLEPRLLAFVLRREGPVRAFDLGPVEEVERAVAAWRAALRRPPEKDGPSVRVRRLVWDPIEEAVGDVRLVLVSPDGPTCLVPFAALPAGDSGGFLVTRHAFAIEPLPRLLPALVGGGAAREESGGSLLLVGDVDFGTMGKAGEGLLAGGRLGRDALGAFRRLPATAHEVADLADRFARRFPQATVTTLRRERATEEAFRREAPGHRWLHVATHGFFVREEESGRPVPVALEGAPSSPRWLRHPGLRCGLALAGANGRPDSGGDDGILTALEVAAMRLEGVEVVVLSACETGLGEEADGEGILGLQRAFQVAGAGTTLTSLWSVPDEATAALMKEFYARLWASPALSKAEALRQAQLALLEDRGGSSRAVRGVIVKGKPGGSGERPGSRPPFFWAGFVLAGDWR